jgi:hypothetical protein
LQQEKEDYVQETEKAKPVKSSVGTVLIILSGLILYADKLFVHFNIELNNLYGWPSTEDLVWVVSQSLSPILLLVAAYLRPYIFAVVVPAFCYALQLGFIFTEELIFDRHLTWVYLIGSITLMLVAIYALKKRLEDIDFQRNIEYYNLLDENQQLKAELEKAKRRAA